MTTRKDLRRPRDEKWDLLDAALDLSTYSANVLSGRKFTDRPQFGKRFQRMDDLATSIYHNIRVANRKDLRRPEEQAERERLQAETIDICEMLITDIEISKALVHMRAKQLLTWTDKIRNIEERIKGWRDSDRKRQGL